jgi:serine/threonine protein kinase
MTILVALMAILFPWLFKRGYLEIKRKEKREKELYAKLLEYEMPENESDSDKLAKTNLKINLNELKFTTKISEGAGGVVYKGTWYHQTVAIKKLKVADEQSFVREVSVLNRLRHPNVLELYGYCDDSKGYQYIITEFMDKGSLDSIMYSNEIRNFGSKLKSLLDICHGMKFLHERKIMHRDLKPQNVLVNKDNKCKLCDFGLAKVMNETLTVGAIGTWQYMAPEIMNESETYNEKCDIYSFGIMMHEIFTLSKPYTTSEYINLLTMSLKILNGHRPNTPSELLSSEYTEQTCSQIKEYFFKTNELSESVLNSNIDIVNIVKMYFELCTSCWSSNPSERPMFEEIIIKLQDIENLLHNKINDFDDKQIN